MSDENQAPSAEQVLGEAGQAHTEKVEELKAAASVAFKGKIIRSRVSACKLEKLKCWPEVLALIENGESIPKIAAYIQDDQCEYMEATRDGVESALYYWVKKSKKAIGERTPVVHMQLISSNPGRIDPVDALNMLFAIQVDRITDHYVAEKRAGRYTEFNTRAIKTAAEIAKTMAEIDAKRRRYAPPPPAGGKTPNDVANQIEMLKRVYEQRYGGPAARAIMNDESRRRILNALERVRKGNSEKLMEILNDNEERAVELAAKEEARLRAEDEDRTIDVEAGDAS